MLNKPIDFSIKGADQDLLCNFVYPHFHRTDDITQHYILGYGHSGLTDCHHKVPDIELPIPEETKDLCNHMGSAGYHTDNVNELIKKYFKLSL
jgi:hypothetical protein